LRNIREASAICLTVRSIDEPVVIEIAWAVEPMRKMDNGSRNQPREGDIQLNVWTGAECCTARTRGRFRPLADR
jgi:hypothetical protein